jgi:hypothetical protein
MLTLRVATSKKEKGEIKSDNTAYLNQHILNIVTSICNQYKI